MPNPQPGFFKPKNPKAAVPEQPTDPYADLYGYVTQPTTTGLGGFVDQLKYINQTSPGAFMSLGAGLMAGDTAGGISNAAQALERGGLLQQRAREKLLGRQEEQQNRNLTRQWLLGQGFDEATADAAMANPEILQQLLAAPKGTDDITEYNLAKQQGFQGSFVDFKLAQIRAGVATPPAPPKEGYRIVQQADGTWAYEKIPIVGGDPKEVVKEGQMDTNTETIVTAADRARTAAGSRAFGPYGQKLVADWFKTSDAAETVRQVEVLKSQAKIENLQKMRDASPTGGALGSVTEQETNMLAAKAGVLDPESPYFERDVTDYERTLLKIIHGPKKGEELFQTTRKREGTPTITTQEEYDALQSGDEYIEDGVRYKKP